MLHLPYFAQISIEYFLHLNQNFCTRLKSPCKHSYHLSTPFFRCPKTFSFVIGINFIIKNMYRMPVMFGILSNQLSLSWTFSSLNIYTSKRPWASQSTCLRYSFFIHKRGRGREKRYWINDSF